MKGLKVIRAQPNNAIDIYPMLEQAVKEGHFLDNPSKKDLQVYYFQSLLKELANDYHLWFLARRGRGFLGFVHAIVVPRRWDGALESIVVDSIFVTDNRRKNGIGGKLIEEVRKAAENIGIRKIEFLCPEEQVELWVKKQKAKKISSLMRVEL